MLEQLIDEHPPEAAAAPPIGENGGTEERVAAMPLEADRANHLQRLLAGTITFGDEEVFECFAHAGEGEIADRETRLDCREIGGAGRSNAKGEDTRSHAIAAVNRAEKTKRQPATGTVALSRRVYELPE